MQQKETNEYKIKKQEMDKCKIICDIMKVLLWVAIILIVLIVGVAYVCPFASEVLTERTIFVQKDLTEKELNSLMNLVRAKKIYTIDFVMERIVSFYELLITYLLGLFVFTGFLGYLYIKNSNKADIQDEVFNTVHSSMFSDLTDIEVKRIFSEEKKEGGELYKISGYLENLVSRVEFIEDFINNEDITIKVKGKSTQSTTSKKKAKKG